MAFLLLVTIGGIKERAGLIRSPCTVVKVERKADITPA
jgi:hypothetical protein